MVRGFCLWGTKLKYGSGCFAGKHCASGAITSAMVGFYRQHRFFGAIEVVRW